MAMLKSVDVPNPVEQRVHSVSAQPGRAAESARLLSGLYFIAMALGVNLVITLRDPSMYARMAGLAVLPPYHWLLRDIIPRLATPFTLLLIAFELGTGLLMLGRGRAVKLGLLGAIAFQLAIIPGLGVYGLVNLPVVAVQGWLLRKSFGRSSTAVLLQGTARGDSLH